MKETNWFELAKDICLPQLPSGVSFKDIDHGGEEIGIDEEPHQCECGNLTMNESGLCGRCEDRYAMAERKLDEEKDEV